MQAFLEYVVKGLVEHPGEVSITPVDRGGMTVYGLACFLTGAFALDDLKILLKRRARDAA